MKGFSASGKLDWTALDADASVVLLKVNLQMCQAKKLLIARGRQRTDSTHVLGAIRAMNRLECSGEVVRHTLNVLAVVCPGFATGTRPTGMDRPLWPRVEEYRLPKSETLRQAQAQQIGLDGYSLLDRIAESFRRRGTAVTGVN